MRSFNDKIEEAIEKIEDHKKTIAIAKQTLSQVIDFNKILDSLLKQGHELKK